MSDRDTPPNPKTDAVNTDADGLQAWKTTPGERQPGMMIFRPRYDTVVHPSSGAELKRLVLETPDWVNVVARTAEGQYVFVKQYRFGVQCMTWELPGGMVEKGEPHRKAAQRELAEESGFTGGQWTYLGHVQPNPAFHDNRCHHWLAEGVELTEAQNLDSGEDIAIVLLDEEQIRAGMNCGEIEHSLVHTGLSRVLDLRGVGDTSASED